MNMIPECRADEAQSDCSEGQTQYNVSENVKYRDYKIWICYHIIQEDTAFFCDLKVCPFPNTSFTPSQYPLYSTSHLINI